MRIGRTIIIPAILALGAAGSIMVASVAPAAALTAPSYQVCSAHTCVYYHN
jgi:hypothetical protein